MPTITLPIPVYELLAELSKAETQGMNIRSLILQTAYGEKVKHFLQK